MLIVESLKPRETVYAVVSFSVSQRVREIGILMALGAQRGDVVSLVLRSGTLPVVAGLGLFAVSPPDPLTLTVVSLLLFVAAWGAIWIPAHRAAALDPLASLRYE